MAGMAWEADIDATGAVVNKSAQMRRIYPLLVIVACVVLLVVGVLWKILSADECVDQGGIVVAPMTRSQHCVDQ